MPELDASSMKIFGRMLRLMKHLGKERALAMAPFGFREGEFDVLATLRRAGEPYCLSPTQLYTSLLITSGAMANRLNHLEQQGLIRRIADPDDKRSSLVSLTPHGQARIEQALLVLEHMIAKHIRKPVLLGLLHRIECLRCVFRQSLVVAETGHPVIHAVGEQLTLEHLRSL